MPNMPFTYNERSLQYKIGDRVMHASHGSGQIVAIENKQLSGRELRPYYGVSINKSIIWVPAESEGISNLRPLVSSNDLTHYRDLLKSRPAPLNENWRQRERERFNTLRDGSFEIKCEVIRDLTAYGWPKPLRESEARELRKIQDAVSEEWASAEGVLPSVAYREITALLLEGCRIFKPEALTSGALAG